MEAALKRRSVEQTVLKTFSKALANILDLEKFLKTVTDVMVETFGVSNASLILYDKEDGKYKMKASTNLKEEIFVDTKVLTMESIFSWFGERDNVLNVEEIKKNGDSNLYPKIEEELKNLNSHICAPLTANGKIIGVLNLGNKTQNGEFSPEDVKLLSVLADFLAAIIDHALFHKVVSTQANHHRSILENIVSGIITINTGGKITTFNLTAGQILGFKTEQVLGKNIDMLPNELANLLLDTLRNGKEYKRKEIFISPGDIPIGVSTSQFHNSKGQLIGAAMVFANLSKVKQDDREIRREDEIAFWERLATSLAHEIKNSLVVTKALTQVLPAKYEDEEFRQMFCDAVSRDTQRLDEFIGKLVEFAQPKESNFQLCDVHTIIDEALSELVSDKKLKDVVVIKKYAKDTSNIRGDYYQLKEAFSNMLLNGIESMPKGGNLIIFTEVISKDKNNSEKHASYPSISAKNEYLYKYRFNRNEKSLGSSLERPDLIKISISDKGYGIARENIYKIFDPFFTTKKGRAGFGLATVQKVIENHNGFIEVESKVDEGTTFMIFLPVEPKN